MEAILFIILQIFLQITEKVSTKSWPKTTRNVQFSLFFGKILWTNKHVPFFLTTTKDTHLKLILNQDLLYNDIEFQN